MVYAFTRLVFVRSRLIDLRNSIGVKRVDDKWGESFVKERTREVVAVIASVLESYFYSGRSARYRIEP